MREIIKRLLQVAAVLLLIAFCEMNAKASDIAPEYKRICKEAGCEYKLSPYLLEALILRESNGNPEAVSRNGKNFGLCQLHIQYFDGDLLDPQNNIHQAAEYLHSLEEEYGDMALALMKYHGEANAEEKYERGEISSYARGILNVAAELEESMTSIIFDEQKALADILAGKTNLEKLAKEHKCHFYTLEKRIRAYCKKNDIECPKLVRPGYAGHKKKGELRDKGKVGALTRAGWSVHQIAIEMAVEDYQVIEVLNEFASGIITMKQFEEIPKEEEYV